MTRQRSTSVPVGAMVAALVVIAMVALVALYFGNNMDWSDHIDPPATEWESGNH